MSELNDMTCAELADVAAELALGVLTGRERAMAIAHLDRCDECREHVRQLMATGEQLLELFVCAPYATPVDRLTPTAGHEPVPPRATGGGGDNILSFARDHSHKSFHSASTRTPEGGKAPDPISLAQVWTAF